MTATFLQSELSSLIQDAKKKHPDVKIAAEKCLADLKALSVTSEAQLAGDLLRRPSFIDPFILACKSRNAKLATTGVVCLQRLTASRAVPRERLKDVLDGFRDVASTGQDVQLKILQTLPSLLQLYGSDLSGPLLAATLEVCGTLQTSRNAVITSTAAATFQQLTTTVFERVEEEDRKPEATELEDGQPPALSDAAKLFSDLCGLADNDSPEFAQIKSMSSQFLLEVVGTILANHKVVFLKHPELIETSRHKLMPALVRLLATKVNYAMTVRILRIVYLLVSRHLEAMEHECEETISTMIKLLDPDQSPLWKRVLCMEVIRAMCQEPALLPRMFECFDERRGKKGTVASLLASFVRIASEDPALIGLGRQSTAPSRRGAAENSLDDITVDTVGTGGVIGSVLSADSAVTGISMEWSVTRAPYMEQLDRFEPSDIPSTYIYSLVINCLVAIADGLAKFVMPLSVPNRGQWQRSQTLPEEAGMEETLKQTSVEKTRPSTPGASKYNRLVNPLRLEDHPRIGAIRVCANLIDSCWPAFLAACSTFLNSALDAVFYHSLVRAFQKMIQVAGVLELNTPREALLTCLAKAAVPINTHIMSSPSNRDMAVSSNGSFFNEKNADQNPMSATPRQSIDFARPSLSVRNLLCMRALLNLGVALGPTLDLDSWFIILETLLQVESIVDSGPKRQANNSSQVTASNLDSEEIRASLGTEIVAVRTASKRMLESTKGYSNEGFSTAIYALLKLTGWQAYDTVNVQPPVPMVPGLGADQRDPSRSHRASRSLSGLWKNHQQQEHELSFVLDQLNDFAKANIERFTTKISEPCSWNLVVKFLLKVIGSYEVVAPLRIKAATFCSVIAAEAMNRLTDDREQLESERLRKKCLSTLLAQVSGLEYPKSPQRQVDRTTDEEIHSVTLEALEGIIGQNGEGLSTELDIVFELLRHTFQPKAIADLSEESKDDREAIAWSPKILKAAFRSLQLILSDFVNLFDQRFLAELTNVLLPFGSQKEDLNISLTTSNFFGNVASLLQEHTTAIHLAGELSETELADIAKSTRKDESAGPVWLLLILRLNKLCLDDREDVRNSAMRMMVRVLEASGSKQTGAVWNALLCQVFFANLNGYHDKSLDAGNDISKWQSSISQALDWMTDLIVRNVETIAMHETFPHSWEQLSVALDRLLDQEALGVWAAVYASLSKLLAALRGGPVSRTIYVESPSKLYLNHHPANTFRQLPEDKHRSSHAVSEANQPAFVQHANLFIEIYLSLREEPGEVSAKGSIDTGKVMQSLSDTIFNCTHPQYTSDVKTLAPEQVKVVAILPMLRELMGDAKGNFTTFLLTFINSTVAGGGKPSNPGSTAKGPKPAQKPTFVAFSAQCINILEQMISTFPENDDIFQDLSVTASIHALAAIINTQYSTTPQNPDLPLWRAASRTVNAMIATAVHHVTRSTQNRSSDQLAGFFSSTIAAATAMLTALNLGSLPEPPPAQRVLSDESFDIESFHFLHNSIIPTLGLPAVSQEIRKNYVITLYRASLVAQPWFFEIPKDLVNKPLANFSTIRRGTVSRPVFPIRQRICDTALDALFRLVEKRTQVEGSAGESPDVKQQRLTLATTAAPYLLLRIAHAFKTFMADQPLRSLTPLPRPLSTDLLTMLKKCLELTSEDAAFTALAKDQINMAGANGGDGKEHLRILYPLLLRLQEIWAWCPRLEGGGAWQETEDGRAIEDKMREWARVVAGDWGIME